MIVTTGAALASHMDIDKAAFTGSTAVGHTIIKTLDPDPNSLEMLDPDPYPDPDSLFFLYIFRFI
jgi:acyl-CoA reductase-like NAD-dependent aldehyde dehydrogenase